MIEYTVKVYVDGSKNWFLDSKLHREDGPAAEFADGTKVWYFEGKRHREDGPAVERPSGTKEWYLEGVGHTEEGYLKKTQGNTCEGKVIEVDGIKYKLMKE